MRIGHPANIFTQISNHSVFLHSVHSSEQLFTSGFFARGQSDESLACAKSVQLELMAPKQQFTFCDSYTILVVRKTSLPIVQACL